MRRVLIILLLIHIGINRLDPPRNITEDIQIMLSVSSDQDVNFKSCCPLSSGYGGQGLIDVHFRIVFFSFFSK